MRVWHGGIDRLLHIVYRIAVDEPFTIIACEQSVRLSPVGIAMAYGVDVASVLVREVIEVYVHGIAAIKCHDRH